MSKWYPVYISKWNLGQYSRPKQLHADLDQFGTCDRYKIRIPMTSSYYTAKHKGEIDRKRSALDLMLDGVFVIKFKNIDDYVYYKLKWGNYIINPAPWQAHKPKDIVE